MRCPCLLLIPLLLAASVGRAPAATNLFIPVADTSLLEVSPTNNLGGFIGMNSGSTQEYNRTRALLRFNLTAVPTNAVIVAARLRLEVTRNPDEPPNNAPFGLHRMLRAWGEGNKSPVVQPGKGLPASPGEATWLCAFHPTNTWSIPGGAPDADYSSIESASQFIYGVGESPYFFESTPELINDVTTWVRNPGGNFGWMLLCDDEASNFTARRFATREDPNNPPELEIQFLVPPVIEAIQKTAGTWHVQFTARAGQTYAVEFRDSLSIGNWQPFAATGPFATDTLVLQTDSAAVPQRFYRVTTW